MTGFVGEVRTFAGTYVPRDWVPCDGRELSIAEHEELYTLIGTTFGGNGATTFAVPDLRGRSPLGAGTGTGLTPRTRGERGGTESVTLTAAQMPAHQHALHASAAQATDTAPDGRTWAVPDGAAPYAAPQGSATLAATALTPVGGNQPHENRSPVVALNFGICASGAWPTWGDDGDTTIAEVRLWAGGEPPQYWMVCDGRELAINQHQALFSLVGTIYGGNGVTTFRLPDLRGRVPVHVSPTRPLGLVAGAENVTLQTAQMPQHVHIALGSAAPATAASPAGATWAIADRAQYAATPQVAAAPTGVAGGSQPHPNMPPYTVLSFIIATQGVYPSRN